MDPEDVMIFKTNIGFLSQIRGMKNKQPLISESSALRNSRKSIVAIKDIKKGDVITSELLAFKRPGIGISPSRIDEVIGKTALVDIAEDTLIDFDMFE